MKIVKELKGYSGSKIFLMKSGNEYFVRKQGNVARNYERLNTLKLEGFPVVSILDYSDGILDLEYVQGSDMESYLKNNNPYALGNFIVELIKTLNNTEKEIKDYTNIYLEKISWIDQFNFSFTSEILLGKLPKTFNSSQYFGDLTLENILFNNNKGFIIIDPATIEYDSWIFDLAKLNQDITCKWFLRNSKINLDHKLILLKKHIEKIFGQFNNNLTIVMLLRIYRHALNDFHTRQFLDRQINLLWK